MRAGGPDLARQIAEEAEEARLRARLSIDSLEARRRERRAELDAQREARRTVAIPVHRARARSRKMEAMLAHRKDAAFYRLLAGRLEEIDLQRDLEASASPSGEPPPPAIAVHALTYQELQDLDRAALQTLDREIHTANYTPPGGPSR